MIRLWLSRRSAVTLRDQLSAQIMLGILSQDLEAGRRLPSVRDLGRRLRVHPNTVSAAYRDLVARGWLESKPGSGVFVRSQAASAKPPANIDALILTLLRTARDAGWSDDQIRARVAGLIGRRDADRVLIIEPEPELRAIYASELAVAVGVPVSAGGYEALNGDLSGALVVASRAREIRVRAALADGVPSFFMSLRSVPGALGGEQRPTPSVLIGIASRSAELRHWIGMVLLSVGIHPDGLVQIDAGLPDWKQRLGSTDLIIADVIAAAELPDSPRVRIVRLLSEASVAELRAHWGSPV